MSQVTREADGRLRSKGAWLARTEESRTMSERSVPHRVQWGETDAGGIVFYPNYFTWFDAATHHLFREIGCPISSLLERGFIIPIVEAHGRFTAALAYEDELSITSAVAEVRRRALRVEHRVKRGQEVVCEGYEVRVWARLADGRVEAAPIPDNVRALLLPGEGAT